MTSPGCMLAVGQKHATKQLRLLPSRAKGRVPANVSKTPSMEVLGGCPGVEGGAPGHGATVVAPQRGARCADSGGCVILAIDPWSAARWVREVGRIGQNALRASSRGKSPRSRPRASTRCPRAWTASPWNSQLRDHVAQRIIHGSVRRSVPARVRSHDLTRRSRLPGASSARRDACLLATGVRGPSHSPEG